MRVILPKNLPHIAKTRCVETFDVTLEDKAEVCDGVRVNKSYLSAGQFVEAQFAPKAVKPLLFWQNKLYVLAEDGVYTLFEGEATRLVTKGGQDGSCTVFNNGVVFSGVKIGTIPSPYAVTDWWEWTRGNWWQAIPPNPASG